MINSVDLATELLIYLSIVFAPWAFGTVHGVSILAMNLIGTALGILWFLGWWLRQGQKVNEKDSDRKKPVIRGLPGAAPRLVHWAFGSTLLVVVYVLIHTLNARADFDPTDLTFLYNFEFVSWLPHSFDKRNSWNELWEMAALWSFFWVTRSWMRRDSFFSERRDQDEIEANRLSRLPARTRRFLFVLVINSGLLALVSVLQRLDGTEDLLWLYHPKFQSWDIGSHFGPFGYRGNAATYFNLVWPVGLFLLLMCKRELIHRHRIRQGSGVHVLLFPVVGFIAIAPLITSSRGGGMISVLLMFVLSIWYLLQHPRRKKAGLIILIGAFVMAVGAMSLGGDRFLSRIQESIVLEDKSGREGRLDIYQHFGPILRDNSIWGTGPGSFSSVYSVHRQPSIQGANPAKLVLWSAWAHSDPIETLITYGAVGTGLLLASFGFLIGPPTVALIRRRIDTTQWLFLAALIGMILHSFIDFPFQIYSLQHLFVVVLVVYSTLGEINTVGSKT